MPARLVAAGAADRAPLVLLHGFTQTGSSWAPVVEGLVPTGRGVVTVDLPGHGRSSPELDGVDLATSSALVAATTGRAVYVGYSMGGRVALRLALDRPELVEAIVLIGATAGISDDAERSERRASDELLAGRIESIGTAAFVDEWMTGPLFRGLEPTDADLTARRANRPEGLAASLRHAGTATMDPPWWDDLPAIRMPVLAVHGELDTKFALLARRMVDAIGSNATRAEIPGVGHAAHLEDPTSTTRLVVRWLADLGREPARPGP